MLGRLPFADSLVFLLRCRSGTAFVLLALWPFVGSLPFIVRRLSCIDPLCGGGR